MDFLLAFFFFAVSMIFVLFRGYAMGWAMLAGYVVFFCVALHRGFRVGDLLKVSLKGAKESMIVVRVLLLIGILTGLWRSSGTFAILVAWGTELITPSMFILACYLFPAFLSYAIGTSFGVAGTLGVALMTMARAGGVNEFVTAGAIMSGIYFGDRSSPTSSNTNLVVAVSGGELYSDIRLMMRTALVPVICCVAFYAVLSLRFPMLSPATGSFSQLKESFVQSPWNILPAIIVIVLPLCKVQSVYTFACSIAVAFFEGLFIQRMPLYDTLSCAILGYRGEAGTIATLFNGGGLLSMVGMCVVLLISGAYSGIFDETGILRPLQQKLNSSIKGERAHLALALTSTGLASLFCTQAIAVIMTAQIFKQPYRDAGRSSAELVQDISNSVVVIAGIVPWCIACSVPLGMLNVGYAAIPFALYLYLLPIYYCFAKKHFKKYFLKEK